MAKMRWKGMEEYELKLSRLKATSEEVAKKAVYEGAKIVADKMKEAIRQIPVDDKQAKPGEVIDGVSRLQKAGLIDGFGIAKVRNDNGYINVKLGFDGYNQVKTKTYPNGQPNVMIARSIESGTSFRQAYPFVNKAVNSVKHEAEQAMQQKIDEEIEKIMK